MKHQKPLSKRFWWDDIDTPFYKRWARKLERLFLKREVKEILDAPVMDWVEETAPFTQEAFDKIEVKEK